MRNARNERNERLFQREEWLTKTQIMGFFSRLASRQRTRGQDATSKEQTFDITADENDDIDALIGDSDRNNLLNDIQSRIGLEHECMTHMIFAPIIRKESYRPSMLQCSRLFFGTLKYLSEQKIERQTLLGC